MPILDPNTLEFFSRSPEQTRRIGIRLGSLLHPGDVVCLTGDLGSGKTTFTQGITQGWGSLERATSPTFVLVNLYGRPDGHNLHHLDAYRLSGPLDAEDLDLIEMLENGALVVEWADRIMPVLPAERLEVAMRWMDEEKRGMVFSPVGPHYRDLLVEFRHQVFGG